MSERIKKVWNSIAKRLGKSSRKQKFVYPIDIPVAGIREEQIRVYERQGSIIVESEQQIIIEEAEQFKPSKMYNSFGFNRSVFLPDGIPVSRVRTKILDDRLLIGWPTTLKN